jgi:hypothetical protein
MKNVITKSESSQPVGETAVYLFDDWFDPIKHAKRLEDLLGSLTHEQTTHSLHSARWWPLFFHEVGSAGYLAPNGRVSAPSTR